ncbi:MAG: hypothetical protein ACTHN5_01070 [Phycisphaerae bacterium]
MKQNRRIFWLAAIIVCTLCTAVTTILLIRSYFRADLFMWQHTRITNAAATPQRGTWSTCQLHTGMGGFTMGIGSNPDAEQVDHPAPDWRWTTMIHPYYGLVLPSQTHYGFRFHRSNLSTGFGYSITFPGWLILLPLAALSWLSFRGWRRSKPRNRTSYPKCGYDLRATKDRCPECGTPIEAANPSTTTS